MEEAMGRTSSHARSSSLPSWPHPVNAGLEGLLSTLRDINKGRTSGTASSLAHRLGKTKDLYDHVSELIQLPLNQQALAHEVSRVGLEDVLEGSLGLLDLCSLSSDSLSGLNESIIELQSSIRRGHVEESCLLNYMASRKKIDKVISKGFVSIREMERRLQNDGGLTPAVVHVLKEAESASLLTLKCVLAYVSGTKAEPRGRSWSLVAKLMQPKLMTDVDVEESEVERMDSTVNALISRRSSTESRVKQNLLNQLRSLEVSIHQLQDGLELVCRCLVRTRVFLLNAMNHC